MAESKSASNLDLTFQTQFWFLLSLFNGLAHYDSSFKEVFQSLANSKSFGDMLIKIRYLTYKLDREGHAFWVEVIDGALTIGAIDKSYDEVKSLLTKFIEEIPFDVSFDEFNHPGYPDEGIDPANDEPIIVFNGVRLSKSWIKALKMIEQAQG